MAIIGTHALLYTSEPEAVRVRGEPLDDGYGVTTTVVLAGGLDVMLYEPRHDTAI
jgi:hypothetical protein